MELGITRSRHAQMEQERKALLVRNQDLTVQLHALMMAGHYNTDKRRLIRMEIQRRQQQAADRHARDLARYGHNSFLPARRVSR